MRHAASRTDVADRSQPASSSGEVGMTRILKYHGREVSIIKQMQAGLPYSLRIADCDTYSRRTTPFFTFHTILHSQRHCQHFYYFRYLGRHPLLYEQVTLKLI
jgi:hypothetical protein